LLLSLTGLGIVAGAGPAAAAVSLPGVSAGPDVVVGEGDGHVNLSISLAEPGTKAVTVSYATKDGTASSCDGCSNAYEYSATSGTVTFTPGQTTKTVPVTLVDTTTITAMHFFTFNLSAPTNATISRAAEMVSIVPNGTQVATPGLFVRNATVDATAGTVSIPVLLGGPSGQTSNTKITVQYATSDGSAVAGTDYTASSGTLTFPAGETVQNIVVPILGSATSRPARSFAVTLSQPAHATIQQGTGTVTIGASGAKASTQPGISAGPDVVVGEGDGYVDLPISLAVPGTKAVTVSYATKDGTASSCDGCSNAYEYSAASGAVTFAPGQTTKVVRVELEDTTSITAMHFFTFNLSAPTNATISRAGQMVSIVPNGAQVATPGLFVRSATVDATAGTVSIPVLLGGPSGQTSNSKITVQYATSDGSAVAGTDYTTTSGTLTFPAGETVQDIVIPILGSATSRPARSFAVTLSQPVHATIQQGGGVVTIGASGAKASSLPGISAGPDVVVGEGDGYVDLPISLAVPGTKAVTVSYATRDGTASSCDGCSNAYEYSAASGAVTFAPGQTTKVVRVELEDTTTITAMHFFTFNLSAPTNATISRAGQMVSIVPNGAQVATPGLFVRSATVDATAGTVSIPVLLGGPSGQASNSKITVQYATSDGSAVAGTDYTASSGTLTFPAGETVQDIVVPIVDSPVSRPKRSFAVTLSQPVHATIQQGGGVVTIGASGAKAVTKPGVSAGPDVVVGEADGYVDLAVSLAKPGTLPVTLSYTTTDGTASSCDGCSNAYEYSAASGAVTFAPGQTTKVVRVEIENTGITVEQYFTFNISNATNATITRAAQKVSIKPPA
jgi:chitinase